MHYPTYCEIVRSHGADLHAKTPIATRRRPRKRAIGRRTVRYPSATTLSIVNCVVSAALLFCTSRKCSRSYCSLKSTSKSFFLTTYSMSNFLSSNAEILLWYSRSTRFTVSVWFSRNKYIKQKIKTRNLENVSRIRLNLLKSVSMYSLSCFLWRNSRVF